MPVGPSPATPADDADGVAPGARRPGAQQRPVQTHSPLQPRAARRRWAAGTVATALVATGLPLVSASPARAIEVPPGDPVTGFQVQTNGPASDIGFGDQYSSTAGSNTSHTLSLYVPTGWPAGKTVDLDLYSAAFNTNTTNPGYGKYEEIGPDGTVGNATYSLTGPGGVSTTQAYPPINQPADSWTRFASLANPTPGRYTLTVTMAGDEQNGWKLRWGTDSDNDPTNAPPANNDNPDGVAGTGDELQVGVTRTTYQQDSGANQCLTLFEYVDPGQASVTFNNFDMDGGSGAGTGVRYYPPSATVPTDPLSAGITGTVSAGTVWNNGGTATTRGGDAVAAAAAPQPGDAAHLEAGWWKVITCISNNNQFIQEGQANQPAFFSQPGTPKMTLTKDDGQTAYDPGQVIPYVLTPKNVGDTNVPGAADKVVLTDTLPAGLTYTSCVGAGWTCTAAGQVVTATHSGVIAVGAAAPFTLSATATTANPPASLVNSASIAYQDLYQNQQLPVVATDTDTVSKADLSITKSHTGSFTVGTNGAYTVNVANATGGTLARGVKVVDTLPAGLTYVSCTGTGWTCTVNGQVVTALYGPALATGTSAPALTITVAVGTAAFPSKTNSATVSSNAPDPTPANNTATDAVTTVNGASIGDKVFQDNNGDGLQTTGEPGVGGVKVDLLDSTQTQIATTTTSAVTATLGAYSFTGLAPGDYYVRFTSPAGDVFTTAAVGTDRTVDSDPARSTTPGATGLTPKITLTAGQATTTVDAGVVPSSSIGDLVYDDVDGSGTQTTGDAGLANLPVTLSQGGAVIASTTTTSTGAYTFAGLLPGTYVVTVATPTGYTTSGTLLSPHTVTLAAGGGITDTAEDFGFQKNTGAIGDKVYVDANGDGVQQAGETTGVQGVTLTLKKGTTTVATATSDTSGQYLFSGLVAGTYTVTASTVPAGYALTTTNPLTVTITPGQTLLTADVGLQQVTSTIGDSVFNDANGNGTQDAGELGVNGAVVTLFKADGTTQVGAPLTTATAGGAAGQYTFTGLAAGTYVVKLAVPAGFAATTATTQTVAVAAAGSTLTADFGIRSTGALGDTVYNDANGNGAQDNGETGLAGATVTLYAANGTTVLATRTTTASGAYSFANLDPGTYVVKVAGPTGYVQTSAPTTYTTALTQGQTVVTDDFGLQERDASLGDTVYTDANGNSAQDSGELGQNGVTVRLFAGDGTTQLATQQTATVGGVAGRYSFTGLAAGTYVVKADTPTGSAITQGAAGYATVLTAGQTVVTDDIGVQQRNASIGDTIYTDANGNGAQDGTEAGRNGVTVRLYAADGTTLLGTQVTATVGGIAGRYSFTGLAAGSYIVTTDVPTGYALTQGPVAGYATTVSAGQALVTDDFGVQERDGSIGDLAFADANGDGSPTGDTGQTNVTVTLLTAGPDGTFGTADDVTVSSQVTGAGGAYSFTGLAAGSYRVVFTTPANRYATTPTTFDRTLTAGQAVTDADAGFARTASIGDLVFNDANGDASSTGDSGLAGAVVTVTQGATTVATTPATTASGAYSVTGLRAGTYTVSVALPAGYTGTTPSPRTVTLTPGQADTAEDFGGRLTTAALNGTVYVDADASGTRTAGETGLAGAKVVITTAGPDGTFGTADDVTVSTLAATPADGTYSTTGLTAGTYRVTVTPPAGYAGTTPDPVTVTLAAGATATTDFGELLSTGSIGDTVFNDLNGDGTQQAGEPGLGGVTVTLSRSGQQDRTALTTANGSYSFTTLPAGTYTVTTTAPAGYALSTAAATYTTALTAGQQVVTDDFGYQERDATVGDTVYVDGNANGQQDAGETGLAGVTVTLYDAAGTTPVGAPTTTAGNGSYSFTQLPAGSYTVKIAVPNGFVPTTATSVPASVGVGGSDLTADFGLDPSGAVLGDEVFDDRNGNGTQDSGEPGLGGLTVTLRQAGQPDQTTTTSPSGAYTFVGLTAGTYTVLVPTPVGFAATGPVTSPTTVALTANQSDLGEDFGFQERDASVGDTVYDDVSGDGTQATDGSEPGLTGVTVRLYAADGTTLLTSQQTTAGGAYSFTGLPAGSYVVQVVAPTGRVVTTTPYPVAVTVTAGQALTTADVGLQLRTASIGDLVYNDLNGNGAQDSGEPGLGGVTVTLSRTGQADVTALTAPDGSYSFTALAPGTYSVKVTAPAGYTQTTVPATWTTALSGGQTVTTDDFGLQQRRSVVGDEVFVDTNGNGVQDAGETGLAGVTVTLYDAAGTTQVGAPTTTAAGGVYSFTRLPAGTYTVKLTVPAGYATTTPASQQVTVAAATSNLDADFGLQPNGGVIGDTVFNDLNGNGTQDAGEPGLDGLTVTLSQAGQQDQTAVTANGAYSFTGLVAGTYTVTVATPAGFAATGPVTSPDPVTLTSDQSDLTEDFGFQQRNASVGDLVYDDRNGNGTQDAGEPGLGGVTVTLSQAGQLDRTVATQPDGSYSFAGLPAGTYTVTATGPTGYVLTTGTATFSTALTPGQPVTTDDFGFQLRTASIGDTVFDDRNGNGTQDSGELGLGGVTVTLSRAGQADVKALTANDGSYSFTNLAAGSYSVTVTPTTGSVVTTAATFATALTAGQTVTSDDFGLQLRTSVVGDTVFVDTNANGVQDNGETGLAGAVVTLLNAAGTTQIGTPLTTDANGHYDFTALAAGTYTVTLTVPSGYAATSPASQQAVVTAGGSTLTADFGVQPTSAALGDLVFDDLNGNGVRDAGEPGLAGVPVTLSRAGQPPVTRTTSSTGAYSFTGLPAGTYTVSVGTPAGYAATGPKTSPRTITLTGTQSDPDEDFGFQRRDGSIGDAVYDDQNGNGQQDAGEPGLGGVTVTLSQTGQPDQVEVSNPDGSYSFTGLAAGSYSISVTAPTGRAVTTTPYPVAVPLTAGQAVTTADVGLQLRTASIGDTVFSDLNGNGTQDTGEQGVDGATVTLFRGGTQVGTPQQTAGGGKYSFTGLPAGDYTVTLTVPAGTSATTATSVPVTLAAAQGYVDADFGVEPVTGVIGDLVFDDRNGNGTQDAGEPGLAGVTVTLSRAGQQDRTTTTDANGGYSFTGLGAGTYTVTVTTPTGYAGTSSQSSPRTVTLSGTQSDTTLDFGYQERDASIGDTVYDDLNGNGVQDAGEPGLSGVTVQLYAADGTTLILPVQTDANGVYSFDGLPAGSYVVRVVTPTGRVITSSPYPLAITLKDAQQVTTADVGLQLQTASIGDLVFNDLNGNGTQDAGEPGLGGVTVTLSRAGQPDVTASTTGDGSYSFDGLPAGTYTVAVTPLPGSVETTTPATYTTTLTPGLVVTSDDFGLAAAGAVVGTVFNDLDDDGLQGTGETGRGTVTVTLLSGTTVVATTQTDGTGAYSFTGLPVGDYTVRVTVPAGTVASTTATRAITLTTSSPSTTGVDFGLAPATSSIGDTVYDDTNGNGTQDAGEPGLSGVTVTLSQPGQPDQTTTSGTAGAYSFTGLTAGNYTVTVTVPAADTATGAGATRSVPVAAGTAVDTVDFGLQATPPPADQPPAFTGATSNTAQTVTVGGPLTPLAATDPDTGDTLTYTTASKLPAGVTLEKDGTFTGSPTTPGTYTLVVTVSDGRGGTDTTTLTITVQKPAGTPPVAQDDTVSTPGGSTLVLDPRVNDTDPAGKGLTITAHGPAAHGTVTCTGTSCTYTPDKGYVGPDSFTYTVTDANGLTATATVNVTVTNTPPAFTTAPANTGQTVTLGGTPAPVQAVDPNGDTVTYSAPAGSLPPGLTLQPDGTFTGTATTPGTYTVVVTATDPSGATDTTTLVVTVPADQAPAFTSATGNTAQTVPVGGTPVPVTATDPDTGQTLTYTAPAASLPPGVTINPDGTFSGTATTPGTYPVVVTVTDPYGKTDTTTLTITVTPPVDKAPVAKDDTDTTAYGTPVTTPVLVNDTDPDGDPLTVASVTQPVHGSVSCTAAGACTYTPDGGFSGTDTFTYTVSDGRGLTDTATVTITVAAQPAQPPVFDGTTNNTSQTVPVGTPLQPVTATDPNGGTLTYTLDPGSTPLPPGVTLQPDGTFTGAPTAPGTSTVTIVVTDPNGLTDTTTLTITVTPAAVGGPPVAKDDTGSTTASTPVTTQVLSNDTDPDNDPLTVSSVTQPAHGTVTCTATACTYTPDAGYTGTDSYTYTVSDGTGFTDTATVTITVANTPPAFDGTSGNTAQTVPVGGTPTPLSATDPDTGQTLTYTAPAADLPPGITVNPDGTFSGTATTGGTYTVVVTVDDGHGGTDTTTLTITVVAPINAPPSAVDDTTTTPGGQPVTITVLKNDTDPNGNSLTVSSFTQPAHGTVTCTAAGVCTYTPDAGYSGTDSFTYTVSDGHGGTSQATVTVTVTAADQPPVAVPDTATTAEDTPVTFDPRTNDVDPDGDPLTIVSNTQPAHGTVVCTGTGCTYTPDKDYNGPDSFTYTVSDGHGGTSTTTVTLTVTPVNDPPVAVPDKTSTPSGTPVTIPVVGNDTDPDGDALTLITYTQGGHGTVVCTGAGACVYTPDEGFTGTDTFTYTVSDGHGGTSTTTVTVTVTNGAPVAVPDTITVFPGTPTVIPVTNNDSDPDNDPLTVVGHSDPAHGTVTCSTTTCTYTADPGYTGPDSFTYTVTDGHGHRKTTTVTVAVAAVTSTGTDGNGGGTGTGGGTGSGTGGHRLPFTGAPVGQELGWALGLVSLGLVLLLAGRRPRRRVAQH